MNDQPTMDEVFGTANYSNSEFYKVWKLREPDEKKGETETRLVRRLFGPMKGLLKEGKGRFFQYYALHYGYEGVSPKDPTKRRARPFMCLFRDDRETRMVLEPCEKCDDIEAKVAEREAAEKKFQKEGKSDDEIKSLLKPFNDWERKHNRDGKYYFCCMDPATDEYGILMLTPKCKNKLLKAMEDHRKKYPKLDPLKPREGVLFEFVRTGRGWKINDEVKIVEEERRIKTEDGEETVFRPKPAPLTEEQARRAFEICPDLHPSAQQVAKVLTHEQIQQLVASSGDPEEVDRIWGQGQPSRQRRRERTDNDQEGSGGSSEGDGGSEDHRDPPREPETAKAPEPETKQPEAPEETDEDRELREAEERAAALRAKKAAAAGAAKKPEEPKPPKNVDLSSMSDEQFKNFFGAKK